jgi:hypothetical protein
MKKNFSIIVFLFILAQSCFATKPVLSFFNEMKGPELKTFFADPRIIPTLSTLKAEIRMGILDLTPERAEILRELNKAGIPVVAWLLLPEEKGYFFHAGNGEMAIERYKEVKAWADKEGIVFKGIGIDLELDMNDLKAFKANKWKFFLSLPSRLYDKQKITDGHKTYNKLLEIIKKDGYPIESYFVSFIKDETKNGTTSIQQLSGFLDVKVEKEIPMLYTSFIGNAYGILEVNGKDQNLKAVALGSTGGGIDPSMPSLTWEDLSNDLRHAAQFADEIHIFSLEGAVWKGFMPRLIDFDYEAKIEEKPEEIQNVKKMQSNIIMLSNILSHPTLLFIGVFLIFTLIIWLLFKLIKFIYIRVASK